MKYAVIAAGEGSRLAQEGIKSPKPLVEVAGERLIDRLLRVFMANGASEVVAICNEQMIDVQARLQEIQNGGQVPLKFIVKSTPSSMHSMWELSRWLGDEPFVLTTVDTIFRESEFETYIKTFHSPTILMMRSRSTCLPMSRFASPDFLIVVMRPNTSVAASTV